MGIVHEIYPQCDKCDWTNPDELYFSVKECREGMKRDGWKIVKKEDICPYCIEKQEVKSDR